MKAEKVTLADQPQKNKRLLRTRSPRVQHSGQSSSSTGSTRRLQQQNGEKDALISGTPAAILTPEPKNRPDPSMNAVSTSQSTIRRN